MRQRNRRGGRGLRIAVELKDVRTTLAAMPLPANTIPALCVTLLMKGVALHNVNSRLREQSAERAPASAILRRLAAETMLPVPTTRLPKMAQTVAMT